MAENFSSEKELQDLLVKAIDSGDLLNAVVDAAQLEALSDDGNQAYFPILSIDHLSRRASIRQGALALSSLRSLELLTGDKNVSISKGEVLRPDIVCYSQENESLVLFELKKEGQTARQALTELLAYEQEVKNQLPFLGSCDVNYILVSPEWTVLMDHAAASAATWSGKRILCLEAGVEGGQLKLKTRIPPAWKITGSVIFPRSAACAVTLSLYDIDDSDVGESVDHRLLTALSVMAREGDRSGSSGFAILWKDHWDGSLARYSITLCGVSPFAFYTACRKSGFVTDSDGALAAELDRIVSKFDPSGHADGLIKVALSANPILEEVSRPTLEGFMTWDQWLDTARSRAEPIRCEFWGILGDHARRMVLSPIMRSHGRPRSGGMPDWTDPWIAIPMFNDFFGKSMFGGGHVNASSSYRLGCLLGADWSLRHTIKANNHAEETPLHCVHLWNQIDLLAAIDEVSLLANSAVNVESPNHPLRLRVGLEPMDPGDFSALTDWLTEQFLQDDDLHVALFRTGLVAPFLFERNPYGGQEKLSEDAEKLMRYVHRAVLGRCALGMSENAFLPDAKEACSIYLTGMGLADGAIPNPALAYGKPIAALIANWPLLLEVADHTFDAVWHKHAPMAPTQIDWGWLKQGVQESRQRGETGVGVIVGADGTVGTGRVFPPGFEGWMVPCGPEDVYLLDNSNGLGFLTIRKWSDLESAKSLSSVDLNTPDTTSDLAVSSPPTDN